MRRRVRKRRPRGSAGRRPSLKWETTADRSQFLHTQSPNPPIHVMILWLHIFRYIPSLHHFHPLLFTGHAGSADHQPVQEHLPAGGPGSLRVSLQSGGDSPGSKSLSNIFCLLLYYFRMGTTEYRKHILPNDAQTTSPLTLPIFWCSTTVWSDWVHPRLQVSGPAGPTDRLRHVRLFQEPVWGWIHTSVPEGKHQTPHLYTDFTYISHILQHSIMQIYTIYLP